MTVEEAIKHLQQFDPKKELLVEAIDGGEAYAVDCFAIRFWTENDGSETPVVQVMLVH